MAKSFKRNKGVDKEAEEKLVMTIFNDKRSDNLHGLSPSAKLILEDGRRICANERRTFSYTDFKDKMSYGTFRNNISLLMRKKHGDHSSEN